MPDPVGLELWLPTAQAHRRDGYECRRVAGDLNSRRRRAVRLVPAAALNDAGTIVHLASRKGDGGEASSRGPARRTVTAITRAGQFSVNGSTSHVGALLAAALTPPVSRTPKATPDACGHLNLCFVITLGVASQRGALRVPWHDFRPGVYVRRRCRSRPRSV